MKKIGRNDLCPCGSKKKYKFCCYRKENKSNEIDTEIEQALELIATYNGEDIQKGIAMFQELISRGLDKDKAKICCIHLLEGYRNAGEHKKLLDTLEIAKPYIEDEWVENNDSSLVVHIKLLMVSALDGLSHYEIAEEILIECKEAYAHRDKDLLYLEILIELSKNMAIQDRIREAIPIMQEGIELAEELKEEGEAARIKSHYASALIHTGQEEQGLNVMQECINRKIKIGDAEGLANAYSHLAIFYWKKKKYDYALAYIRKDLFIARKIGNKRGLATTLGNIAALYCEMKQVGQAKKVMYELKGLVDELGDEALCQIYEHNKMIIERKTEEWGRAGTKFGPKASCCCGSSKSYEECCGRADYEPVSLDFQFKYRTQDIWEATEKRDTDEDNENQHVDLDYILRKMDKKNIRLAWSRYSFHGPWYEYYELVDMANIYLQSCFDLVKDIENNNNNTMGTVLSVVMLACSAAEAFINQVIYFVSQTSIEIQNEEWKEDPYMFQRKTELITKWNVVAKQLFDDKWYENSQEMENFKNVISIRNEFVHYKVKEYEKIVPLPKKKSPFLCKVPKEVKLNEIAHSWILQILSPDFAVWVVDIIEKLINLFKDEYLKCKTSGMLIINEK